MRTSRTAETTGPALAYMKLQRLFDEHQAAKAAAGAALDRLRELHSAAVNLIQRLDGHIVPTSLGETAIKLEVFMRRANPGGDWQRTALALHNHFLAAERDSVQASRRAAQAEAALSQEAARLNAERTAGLRAERDRTFSDVEGLLQRFCSNDAQAKELAAQVPKGRALDFEISSSAVPLAAEIMAQRFLSSEPQKQPPIC